MFACIYPAFRTMCGRGQELGDFMQIILRALMALTVLFSAAAAYAQPVREVTISTVTRPPFSMVIDGVDTGFSIDLLEAVSDELRLSVTYDRKDEFGDMLDAVQDGSVDAAIANISITSANA